MKTIADLGDVKGKRDLVRSDLNVPLDGERNITDDGRIRASVPTITALAEAGARVVVCAHLGRPKGAPEDKYSLKPVVGRMSELLGRPVAFASDTVGESAHSVVGALGDGEVALLENIRFNPGETSKDDAERRAFAQELAALADAYVSDGFGVVHRKQASDTTSPSCCPRRWVAWWPPRSRCSSGSPSTPSVRMPWCSAGRRSPTSSRSSRTS